MPQNMYILLKFVPMLSTPHICHLFNKNGKVKDFFVICDADPKYLNYLKESLIYHPW